MGFTTWDLLNARRISMTSFSSSSASRMVVFVMPLMSAIPILLEPRVECGAVAVGLDADLPLHPRQAFLDDGEPYAGALIGFRTVQALEDVEDAFPVLGGYADAVVAHAHLHHPPPGHRPDTDPRHRARRHELECIVHEVEEYLL